MRPVVPVWPLAFVLLIPDAQRWLPESRGNLGTHSLREALGFRKSAARAVPSQTGHIWEDNYGEARVAGGEEGRGQEDPAL